MLTMFIFFHSYDRCDADPTALANYVIALVKKDKSDEELKAICADQLDVFLQKGKCVCVCGGGVFFFFVFPF